MKETDLEKRIRRLEDVETIKKLKARYWYCLERKLWDDLSDLFMEDVVDYLGDGQIGCQGRKDVVKHLVDLLTPGSNIHQGYNPIIEFTSDTTATGRWDLYAYMVLDAQGLTGFKGWGSYEDEYVKEEDKWRIKSWKYKPTRLERWNKSSV